MSANSIYRNLICLSLSFLLMFTSYQGLASLQSSFNSVGGLGAAGLAVTYACVVPSALLVSPALLERLGSQRTMCVTLLGYLAYMCLNLLPTWATVIPASAILGLCGAPLWSAMSQHVVDLAADYDRTSEASAAEEKDQKAGEKLELTSRGGFHRKATVPLFFGLFFTIVTSCNIWGNLVSYLALSEGSTGGQKNVSASVAHLTTTFYNNLSCGYRFCGADGAAGSGGSEVERPSMAKFYIMMSCFIAVAAASVLIMFLLVDRDVRKPAAGTDGDGVPGSSLSGPIERIRRALVHLVEPRQLLLSPLTLTAGLSQSFSLGDFTEAFVACSSGIASVGLVMISFGASQVVTGLLVGQIASRFGQAPVLLFGLILRIGLDVGSLHWEVTAEPQWPLHLMSAAYGAVDAIWVTLLNALYGDYFSDNTNAAFSALRFWQSLGFILGFSYNKALCVGQKLYVIISLALLSCITLSICVLVNRRVKRVWPQEVPVKEIQ